MIQNAMKTIAGEPIKKGDLLKMAVGMIVGIGADMAVSAILGTHMPEGAGWRKAMRRIGIFILAMKAGEEAEEYFCKVYDDTRDTINEWNESKKDGKDPVETEGTVE